MTKYLEYGFQGKTAIVTGAGTGIGEACAIELAKGGAKVALFGRRLGPIEDVKKKCLEFSDDVIALSVDVRDKEAVTKAVAKVHDTFTKVDILVNNAGVDISAGPGELTFDALFDKAEPEEYLDFFRIHALGHYLMNLAVIPGMQKNKFGRIVNVSSVLGYTATVCTPAYTASKAAAICQTRAFAQKYGRDNITVNSVAPGMVNTPMKASSTPEEFAFVAGLTPLGRVPEPIEIARAILFFAQENLFVTGQTLVVDGGSN